MLISNSQYDFLYRPSSGQLETYDPARHGLWELVEDENGRLKVQKSTDESKPVTADENGFAAEAHLRDFLAGNLDLIEHGLHDLVFDVKVKLAAQESAQVFMNEIVKDIACHITLQVGHQSGIIGLGAISGGVRLARSSSHGWMVGPEMARIRRSAISVSSFCFGGVNLPTRCSAGQSSRVAGRYWKLMKSSPASN